MNDNNGNDNIVEFGKYKDQKKTPDFPKNQEARNQMAENNPNQIPQRRLVIQTDSELVYVEGFAYLSDDFLIVLDSEKVIKYAVNGNSWKHLIDVTDDSDYDEFFKEED